MNLPVFNDNLRSSGSWAAMLEHAAASWRAAWASEARGEIEARLRFLQASHALLRAGLRLDERRLAELVFGASAHTGAGMNAAEAAAAGCVRAARLVSTWAGEPEARLDVSRLLEIRRALDGADADFRRTEVLPLCAGHDPAPAVILPRLLDNAFDWFATAGFAELRAVEQAALVHLRLLDLLPFATDNEPVAVLAAGFYTERAGLPPLVLFADEFSATRYVAALAPALRGLTQPLVELFAESLALTIRSVSEN